MKEPLDSHREFNTPAEMLSRATFLATLGAVALGLLLMIAGVVVWRPEWAFVGLAVLALACTGRAWLQRRGELAPTERSFERLWAGAPAPDEERAAQLMTLLGQWEAMEEKRGAPDFDPWALQELRNEIRRVVESDPALEQLFDRLRQVS